MMNQESKRPVALEDLLRFKRAERPPAGFWVEFDQELRAKQLAALVEKRPWWRRLNWGIRGLPRYHLPLGATAVLALTLLTIRDYQPVTPARPVTRVPPVEPAVAVAPVASPDEMTTRVAAAPADQAEPETAAAASEQMSLSSEATRPGDLARMVPLLSSGERASMPTEIAPSARSIATNRAVAEVILGTPSEFEARLTPTRANPPEPLAQMVNPAETRRSHFAAAFASATLDTTTVTSARVARRLSDEQLYDSIHRFGASGNSVSFKF